MRYDIDLRESRKRGGPSHALTKERLLRLMTSTPLIALLVIIVVAGIGYFAVFVPFFQHPPSHKKRLQELRLMQRRLEAERQGLIREADAVFRIVDLAPGWASRLPAFGEHLPAGLWLTRIALQEEQTRKGRQPSGRPQTEGEPPRKYLAVEGRVDTRRHPSPLEPVSSYLARLREDRRMQQVLTSLHLVSTRATKEDPAVVAFELRGQLVLAGPQQGAEERIRRWLKAQAPESRGGS